MEPAAIPAAKLRLITNSGCRIAGSIYSNQVFDLGEFFWSYPGDILNVFYPPKSSVLLPVINNPLRQGGADSRKSGIQFSNVGGIEIYWSGAVWSSCEGVTGG